MKIKIIKPRKTVIFTFDVSADWTPEEGLCWQECPFNDLIPPGITCGCYKSENGRVCPFLKAEEDKNDD